MPNYTLHMNRGFSLVELSIVLVILGLLTGGILGGQSLIRAAELRAVTTEYNRYITATHSFRNKYFLLPGDMNNATSFWGSAGGTGSDATCQAATGTGTQTCNGDGDGILLSNASGVVEFYRYWQHLANAGLIEGSYTGASAQTPGVTVPLSKIATAYFHARNGLGATTPTSGTYYAGTVNQFPGDFGRNMYRFRNVGFSNGVADSGPLNPQETWNIDKKMDDGMPSTGIMVAYKGDGTNTFCTSAAGVAPPGDAGATYKLDNSNKDCIFDFARVF